MGWGGAPHHGASPTRSPSQGGHALGNLPPRTWRPGLVSQPKIEQGAATPQGRGITTWPHVAACTGGVCTHPKSRGARPGPRAATGWCPSQHLGCIETLNPVAGAQPKGSRHHAAHAAYEACPFLGAPPWAVEPQAWCPQPQALAPTTKGCPHVGQGPPTPGHCPTPLAALGASNQGQPPPWSLIGRPATAPLRAT